MFQNHLAQLPNKEKCNWKAFQLKENQTQVSDCFSIINNNKMFSIHFRFFFTKNKNKEELDTSSYVKTLCSNITLFSHIPPLLYHQQPVFCMENLPGKNRLGVRKSLQILELLDLPLTRTVSIVSKVLWEQLSGDSSLLAVHKFPEVLDQYFLPLLFSCYGVKFQLQ